MCHCWSFRVEKITAFAILSFNLDYPSSPFTRCSLASYYLACHRRFAGSFASFVMGLCWSWRHSSIVEAYLTFIHPSFVVASTLVVPTSNSACLPFNAFKPSSVDHLPRTSYPAEASYPVVQSCQEEATYPAEASYPMVEPYLQEASSFLLVAPFLTYSTSFASSITYPIQEVPSYRPFLLSEPYPTSSISSSAYLSQVAVPFLLA